MSESKTKFSKNKYLKDIARKENYKARWNRNHPEKLKEYSHVYYLRNKPKILLNLKESKRRKRKEIRTKILQLLGNKCKRCGEEDWRCLQIDHVNGKGWQERKHLNHFYYEKRVLQKIKSGSKEYQLLCANCNWKKKYEKGEI